MKCIVRVLYINQDLKEQKNVLEGALLIMKVMPVLIKTILGNEYSYHNNGIMISCFYLLPS